MSGFNRVILTGNLTRDPDLKYTPNGTAVCTFDLAINSVFTNSKGEKKESTTFIPIVVWRRQAETSAEYLKKGRPVLVEGRLKQERWTNKENQNRSRILVTASLIRFLGSAPKDEKQPPPVEDEQGGTPSSPPPESDNAQPSEEDEHFPF